MISTAALSAGLTPYIYHYQRPTYSPFELSQLAVIERVVVLDIVSLTVLATSEEYSAETLTVLDTPENSNPYSKDYVTEVPIVVVVS